MKVILLTTLIVFVVTAAIIAADSPINAGSITLGGMITYQAGIGEYKRLSIISIYPEFGIFIGSGLLLGSSFIYEQQFGRTSYRFCYAISGFGPMIGIYHNITPSRPKVGGSVYHYFKVSINYLNMKNSRGEHSENTNLSLGSGFNFMLAKAVALDAGAIFTLDRTNAVFQAQNIPIGLGISAFIY